MMRGSGSNFHRTAHYEKGLSFAASTIQVTKWQTGNALLYYAAFEPCSLHRKAITVLVQAHISGTVEWAKALLEPYGDRKNSVWEDSRARFGFFGAVG